MRIDRRSLVVSAAGALAPPVRAKAQPKTSRKIAAGSAHCRNVVLLICDDLGYGDLGCNGGPIPTPNLDKLASEGMRFTQFNAAAPICSASRGCLLTGRYAQRSHTAGCYFPHARTGMALDETTIADLFRKKGHRTKAIGKWHLGDAAQYLPTNRGFESFYGVPYSVDMQPLPLLRDSATVEADTDRDLLTPRYTEEAVRFLDEQSEKPFFLYLAYSFPHDPARASARFLGHSAHGIYGDSVQEIDWSVGEIIRTLDRKGLLESTLVLFTSDHGPWFQGSPGNLRGRKSSTFEGGFRVPLIAYWPSKIPAGAVSHALASNLDVSPTLGSLCGLDTPPKPLDGIDISSILLGMKTALPRRSFLYFTPFSPSAAARLVDGAGGGGMDLHCARAGSWKVRFAQLTGEIYINDYTVGHDSYWLPRPELYDLASDPGESYDVAEEHPDIVAAIFQDVKAQISTFPAEVVAAFAQLQQNVANRATRPGATPRPVSSAFAPWAWIPPDRR